MSRAALTGFVCSLIFIVPLVTQLLGLGFGLFGIFATRRRHRRGKGLAIAAIPISIVFAAGWVALFGFALLAFREINAADREVVAALRASGDERAKLVASLYEQRLSEGLKSRVNLEGFIRWVEAVRIKHGQLQTASRDERGLVKSLPHGGLETRYVGEFINGGAAIAIRYASLAPDEAKVDDVFVDGVGPASP